jgi:hypothetical protein
MVIMSIENKIMEICNGKKDALVVCCWDAGMPRKEPWVVKAFLGKADYASRLQRAISYADLRNTKTSRGIFTKEEEALLVIAPELVARELDYFVADYNGQRVY